VGREVLRIFDAIEEEIKNPPTNRFDPRVWVPAFFQQFFQKHEKRLLLGHGYSIYAMVNGHKVLVMRNL